MTLSVKAACHREDSPMILKSYVQLQLCDFEALDMPAGDALTCSPRASFIQTRI